MCISTCFLYKYLFVSLCFLHRVSSHFSSFNGLLIVASETPSNRAISRLLFPASFKCSNFNSLMVNLGRPFGFPPCHFSSFLFLKNLFSNTLPPAIASKKNGCRNKKRSFCFCYYYGCYLVFEVCTKKCYWYYFCCDFILVVSFFNDLGSL